MGIAHLTGRLRCPRDGTMTKILRAFNGGRLAGADLQDYFARTGTCRLPARRKPPSKLCATLRPSERMSTLGRRFWRLETSMNARGPLAAFIVTGMSSAAFAACVLAVAHAPPALAQSGATMITLDKTHVGSLPADFDSWRTGQG